MAGNFDEVLRTIIDGKNQGCIRNTKSAAQEFLSLASNAVSEKDRMLLSLVINKTASVPSNSVVLKRIVTGIWPILHKWLTKAVDNGDVAVQERVLQAVSKLPYTKELLIDKRKNFRMPRLAMKIAKDKSATNGASDTVKKLASGLVFDFSQAVRRDSDDESDEESLIVLTKASVPATVEEVNGSADSADSADSASDSSSGSNWDPYWVYKTDDDETPREIAKKFDVDLSELLRYNDVYKGIGADTGLMEDTTIYVPGEPVPRVMNNTTTEHLSSTAASTPTAATPTVPSSSIKKESVKPTASGNKKQKTAQGQPPSDIKSKRPAVERKTAASKTTSQRTKMLSTSGRGAAPIRTGMGLASMLTSKATKSTPPAAVPPSRRLSAEERRKAMAKAVAAATAAADTAPEGRSKPATTHALADATIPTAKRIKSESAAATTTAPSASTTSATARSHNTPAAMRASTMASGTGTVARITTPAAASSATAKAPKARTAAAQSEPNAKKKRVRWATKLERVHEIPSREDMGTAPLSSATFQEQLRRDHDGERQSIKEHRSQGSREPRLQTTTPWRGPPSPVVLPTGREYLVQRGTESSEKQVQIDREKRTLAEQFYSLRDVPDSASEPDSTAGGVAFGTGISDHHTAVIPLELRAAVQGTVAVTMAGPPQGAPMAHGGTADVAAADDPTAALQSLLSGDLDIASLLATAAGALPAPGSPAQLRYNDAGPPPHHAPAPYDHGARRPPAVGGYPPHGDRFAAPPPPWNGDHDAYRHHPGWGHGEDRWDNVYRGPPPEHYPHGGGGARDTYSGGEHHGGRGGRSGGTDGRHRGGRHAGRSRDYDGRRRGRSRR
eukprot:m.413626 g.413626  ORF g.413626 m.413626 type:complete len:844 (+) comp21266_c0_seq6:180-2711(+)